jgi:hypothetical protein
MRLKGPQQPRLRRVLFFSYHYPPDQSAGAVRTHALVRQLLQQDPHIQVTVFCSLPKRYGGQVHAQVPSKMKPAASCTSCADLDARIAVRRFWIPFFGQGPAASVVAYVFYMLQAVPAAVWLRPQIVVGTSAKLLTSFVAALSARLTGARLYIDFRDTFADNFFYFYRWHKRILFQSLIMAVENLVLRCASSINMVSVGFQEAFVGWDRVLDKYAISLTNFPNGIEAGFRDRISRAVIKSTSQIQAGASSSMPYRVVYAGNLGEGQDLLALLINLAQDQQAQQLMREQQISFEIFGSGAQVTAIEALLASQPGPWAPTSLQGLVHYRGLVPRDQVEQIYSQADCLMLQLGRFSSLSMVIPTKVFEYAATPYPIVFGASGFTYTFLDRISGTIGYQQCDGASFIDAVVRARHATVEVNQRRIFLAQYDADAIYRAYARHILSSACHKCA